MNADDMKKLSDSRRQLSARRSSHDPTKAAIEALDPRDQMLVVTGRLRALTEVRKILADLADLAEEADGEGRDLVQAVIEKIRPLADEAANEAGRLACTVKRH